MRKIFLSVKNAILPSGARLPERAFRFSVLASITGLAILPVLFFPHSQQLSWAFRQGVVGVLGILALIGLLGLWFGRKKIILGRVYFAPVMLAVIGLVLGIIYAVNGTLLDPIKAFYSSSQGSGGVLLLLVFLSTVVSLFVFRGEIWQRVAKAFFGISFLISVLALTALARLPVVSEWFLGGVNTSPHLMSINQAGVFAGAGALLALVFWWAVRNNFNIFPSLPLFYQKVVIIVAGGFNILLVATLATRFIALPLFGVLLVVLGLSALGSRRLGFRTGGVLVALMLVAAGLLAVGGEQLRFKWANVPSEASLTQSSSVQIFSAAAGERGVPYILFGAGEGSFYSLSEQYKPVFASQSGARDVVFLEGASEVTTFLVENGALSMVVFVSLGAFFAILLGLFYQISALLGQRQEVSEKVPEAVKLLVISVAFLNVGGYLLLTGLVYPLGLGMWAWMLLSFAGAGSLMRSAYIDAIRGDNPPPRTYPLAFSSWQVLAPVLLALMVVGAAVVSPVKRLAAESFIARAQTTANFKQKIQYYNIAQKVFPEYPRALMFASQDILQNALDAKNRIERAKGQLSDSAQAQVVNSMQMALGLGREAVQSEPRSPQLPFFVVDAYFQISRVVDNPEEVLKASLEYIQKAKELTPANPQPWFKEAQVWFEVARTQRSAGEEVGASLESVEKALSEALRVNSNFAPARVAQVEVALFRDDFQEAAQLGEQFLGDYPERKEVRWYTAGAYYRLGEFQKARQHIDAILGQDDSYLPALVTAGKLAAQGGDFPKAIDYFERVRAQRPNLEKLPKILSQLRKETNPFQGELQDFSVDTSGSRIEVNNSKP